MLRYKTPLRYPGGKQKIAPFISEVLMENNLIAGHYAEPYAGGAGVAIELLLEGKVSQIHLNDSDLAVYSFWHSILNNTDEFCRKISRASICIDEWKEQRSIIHNPKGATRLELGYAFFYLNRCNRSGIISGGVIGGLKQDGEWKMDARFPRAELIKRIEVIANKKKLIKIKNWDAERYITNYLPQLPMNTLIYFDPPYISKADRLYYNHYKYSDHKRIASLIQNNLLHHWVMSYDNNIKIYNLYKERKKFIYTLQYNAARAYHGQEIFIFSDKLKIPCNSSIKLINQSLKEFQHV